MAYLGFTPLDGENRAATASDAGLFSSTELRVIGLAERIDATREMTDSTRWGRFAEWALGIPLPRPLADPRLESLRRFASLARYHRDDVDGVEIERFVGAGYSERQAQGLLGYMTGLARSLRG